MRIVLAAALFAAAALGEEPQRGELQRGATREIGDERRWVGEPIDLSLKDADLVETLRSFAEIGDFNLILHPEISGTVTVELKNVPWDQALEAILKIHGLGMDISRSRLTIAPRAVIEERRRRLAEVRTVKLELRYADPAAVAEALNRPQAGILTARGAARADAESGELLLRDTGARLLEIGRWLAAIDVPSAAGEEEEALVERCLATWGSQRAPKRSRSLTEERMPP